MMELTKDVQDKLAEPFPDGAIKWLPKITTKKQGNQRVPIERNGVRVAGCMAHIDARDVMERLDAVVGAANWHDSYQPAAIGKGVECSLTVCGVTKVDVGVPSDTEPEKGAYSDALKRAAVKFGIGRELYAIDTQWLPFDGYKVTVPKSIAPAQNGRKPEPKQAPQAPSYSGKSIHAGDLAKAKAQAMKEAVITEKQRKALHARGVETYGDEWDDKRKVFSERFGKASSNDWTQEEYTRIMDGMQRVLNERNAAQVELFDQPELTGAFAE